MEGAPRSGTPSPRGAERSGPGGPAARRGRWAYLATHALPWFGLGALLVIVGSLAFHDPMESYLVVAGVFVLAAACIRYSVLAVRDDPLRSLMVARAGSFEPRRRTARSWAHSACMVRR